jgi:hypothetical protein
VNPRDPANIVAVWQQDRWANGSANGLMTATTTNGGVNWTRVAVPFSRCAGGTVANGGDYERATDPWVTISPDGIAFQMALSTSVGTSSRFGQRNAGQPIDRRRRTWHPATLIRDGQRTSTTRTRSRPIPLMRATSMQVGSTRRHRRRPEHLRAHDRRRPHLGSRALDLRSGRPEPDDRQRDRRAAQWHAR